MGGWSVSQSASRLAACLLGQVGGWVVGRSGGGSVSQSVSRSAGQSVRRSVGPSVRRSVGQSVSQSVSQSISGSRLLIQIVSIHVPTCFVSTVVPLTCLYTCGTI